MSDGSSDVSVTDVFVVRSNAAPDTALESLPNVRFSIVRRRLLRSGLLASGLLLLPPLVGAVPPAAPGRTPIARLWPAEEYTRLVIETPQAVTFRMMQLQEPYRLVLDVDHLELSSDLMALPSLLQYSDPYILGIRLGRRDSNVLRVVLDLRDRVDPQAFTLQPVAQFGFRLVLDIYPVERLDPLLLLVKEFESNDAMAALEQKYADDEALLALVREYEKRSEKTGTAAAPRKPPSPAKPPSTGSQPAPSGKLPNKLPTKPSTKSPTKPRPIIVMLDPGHGGEDPGAIGRKKTLEKNVVLSIARRTKKLIDAEPNMRAVLTRDGDFYVPLNQRVEKARRVQADLMVSIHADAFTNTTARGSSVFALSERGATSAAARWLAQKENSADLVGGINIGGKDAAVAKTLLDLSQSAQINDSLKAGAFVLAALGTHNVLHKKEVEQAGFAVLRAPDIPSILVETAFISHPEEEAKLADAKHQQRFAESIAAGIKRYFASNPPLARS
ncbi:MAG: N-acetylmuramoyl-L-alanine amidase [Burkholderiales bacterium]|jgi:N-acetylmuramoyl-L-alanine amidase|nr:N-acetylmuramoyl-L-alanine amidase [Burkholderiales bacterium]